MVVQGLVKMQLCSDMASSTCGSGPTFASLPIILPSIDGASCFILPACPCPALALVSRWLVSSLHITKPSARTGPGLGKPPGTELMMWRSET